MKNSILTLFLLHLVLFGFSQVSSSELNFEVNTIYPALSVQKETLKDVQTLSDLHPHYKPSWVREYISVEVLAKYKGKIKKAMSKNDHLSLEQKDIISMADPGSQIMVEVKYIPENTLKDNEMKVFDFKFIVNPENGATYAAGQQQLNQYLKDNVIDKIPVGIIEGYDLAIVKFTIDEEGEIIEPHLFWSSNDETVDELLLETVTKMPCWKPAAYANGMKVKQDFALMVGNMENCMVHTLNIQKN